MIDESTTSQILEIIESRASTYNFLSLVYRQEMTLASIRGLVEQLSGPAEEVAESEGHRMLQAFLAEVDGSDLEGVRTRLACEYAALFLNVSPNPVFPFESVYTSPERLLMQKARDEVLAEYRKEGLDRAVDFREPEDHIAIELEFMGYLCQKTAEALEGGDAEAALASLEKQREFLDRHLLVWVPNFCLSLLAAARSDFYRAVARITEEHLAHEGETVTELVTVLGNTREG